MRRSLLLVGCSLGLAACRPALEDAPKERELSLGQDLYGLVCNRLGASVLTEDLEGASYRGVCTPDESGNYESVVDSASLPTPATAEGLDLRRLAIAKLEALARRRQDLIRALDATFDDGEVPVPFAPRQTVDNHEALRAFLAAMVPLYSGNPTDDPNSDAEPLLPSVTRAAGRLLASLAGPGDPDLSPADPAIAAEARKALESIAGRQGYRPLRMILGALRPVFSYPDLRPFAERVSTAIGPGGSLHSDFQNVLGAVQGELATSVATPTTVPFSVDPLRLQPTRPRTKVEFAAATFLSTSPTFNVRGSAPQLVVARDARGIARPLDLTMLSDANGDGLADVDGTGRFVDGLGGLASLDPPFVSPLIPVVNGFDPMGRAIDPTGKLVYDYIDLSESFLAAVALDLAPILTTDPDGTRGSMTELLRGAFPLWGQSVPRRADWAFGGEYTAFDTSDSPLVDIVHAIGQLIAHPGSDVWLALVDKLLGEHEDVMARVIGALLRVREISNARPDIALSPEVTIWDEMAEWIVAVGRNPVLFRGILTALRDPDLVAALPEAVGNFATLRDRLTYNPEDINSAPLNLTTGVVEPPRTPVDRSLPPAGDNSSILQRSLAMIHDVNGVNACNKEGAHMQVNVGGIQLTWPLIGGYGECELFVFENMGLVYLDAILGEAQFQIRDNLLDSLVTNPLLNGLFSLDQIFEESSGVTGLSLSPSPFGLNRLVFFGAESSKFDPSFGGAMPDRDPSYTTTNARTNLFVSSLVDAVSTSVCPARNVQDPTLGQLSLADCHPSNGGDPSSLLRLRDPGVIFTWETYDFFRGMRPALRAFKDGNAGELFLELVDILNRHWPGPEHGPECTRSGSFRRGAPDYNPMYCAESGVNAYEPIIADAVRTDLLPALAALAEVLDPMQIVDVRRGGASTSAVEILREVVLAFFDPEVSAAYGVVDRDGRKETTWADGVTPKSQTTPFDLFAKALQKNDDLLMGTDRFDGWRRARSTLVDSFFAVSGEGAAARFDNPAVVSGMRTLLRTVREQINANCPDREVSSERCEWAIRAMAENAADTIGERDFSTVMHLVDALLTDPSLRTELERLFAYLVDEIDPTTLQATLTSIGDLLQLLGDTETLSPVYRAVSVTASPGSSTGPGAADRIVTLLRVLVDETDETGTQRANAFDPYRSLTRILYNAVTPLDPNDPTSFSPLEIFMDTIAEVNRIDASKPPYEPLSADDYQAVFATVRDLLTDGSRGLEQVYRIVNGRSDY